MESRYKIIISNQKIYKEIEIAPNSQIVRIGTGVDCDVRLHKEMFFEQITLIFALNVDKWNVTCSDNLYLSVGDVRKLMNKQLIHGDSFTVKYQGTNNDVFNVEFLIDFDNGKRNFNSYIDISDRSLIKIGAHESSDIVIRGNYIEQNDSIDLSVNSGSLYLKNIHACYGVYHNGKRAQINEEIKDSDFFSIADCFFYYKENKLWIDENENIYVKQMQLVHSATCSNYPKFFRNTRVKTKISDTKIEILDPPSLPQKPKKNIFMQLLPSLGMLVASGVMAAFGGVTMLIFSGISAVMSIVMAVLNIRENKKDYVEKTTDRITKYNNYISGKRTEIEESRKSELKALESVYTSQDNEMQMLNSFSSDLFDRQSTDEDFLCVMLGTGDVEAKQTISYKKQERIEFDDELQLMPEKLCNQYRYVHGAPVVCDFKLANAVGIVGDEENRFDLLKNIIIDLATRQYHTDVKMFFVAEKIHAEKIRWLRFLPNTYDSTTGVRNIVCDDESKNLIFENLYKELTFREQNKKFETQIVVFFYDEYGFKSHPISKFTDKAKELGVTFVFFGMRKSDIPMGCDYLIVAKGHGMADLVDTTDKNKTVTFNYPIVSDKNMRHIVSLLAPVFTEEISLEGSLTKNISLFELLNIIAVDDINLKARWESSQVFKSMAAPIGVSKTGVVSLNLHDKAHGPHGLVAGTTGSGKSEILQTYILMMATLFHPYEVGFLIIDFKGGGMVNQFKDLPHLLGAITNIDGKEINRSLKSIKAELQKRQRLFAEADVNHIDKYIRKFKAGETETPLPHLIIIVDEFAELKAEQPDFMKELISAARIGRSLGVHLILATQKPAGQVDDQIWSNSRFKLCLKVQSQEDSNEVLKSPLAAEIKEPGRAYLQVGNNEIFELFQSAYSGASEKMDDSKVKEFSIFEVSESGKKKPVFIQKKSKAGIGNSTQLDAIVRYVADYCEEEHIKSLNNICLPPLPDVIKWNKKCLSTNGVVDIGRYDDPDNQLQLSTMVDVASRNTLIIGASQYGKTNLLQLLIRSISYTCSPKEAVIYILDFGSMVLKNFETLNHVGGVVCASEDEKLKNLFKMIFTEILTRKEKLVTAGVSSFASYLEAGYKDLPHIYLMVDNMTALMELYLENDDSLLNIVREGLSVGISVIVTNAQTNGMGFRYMSNFANKISLYCNDSSEYMGIFDHVSFQPDEKPGRCILEIDKRILECQTYLAFEGEHEFERVQEMHNFINEMNIKNSDSKAHIIPCIPTVLPVSTLYDSYSIEENEYSIPIGLTYNEVKPYYIDFATLGVFGLCGKENVGHRNFINYIYDMLEKKSKNYPVQVVVFDDVKRKYSELKSRSITTLYSLEPEKVSEIINQWHEILSHRYDQILASEKLNNKSELLLMIIQNNDVAKIISDDMELMDKFTDIVSKYKNMGVSFIFANYPNTSISYDAPEPIRMIKQNQHCMFFEDLDNLKPFDVPYDELKANKRRLEIGDAYYISDNSVVKLKMVLANPLN